tara:strand:+ start:6796 stop:7683 length:888 start_codon:yes stop_codon:yes gene_type:complete
MENTSAVMTLSKTGNFEEMAELSGINSDMKSAPKGNTTQLPRLRIYNKPIMGEEIIKGKKKKVELVESGSYRLYIPDRGNFYASEAILRVYMNRFMYKRYISHENTYCKTVMANDLNNDLKDNMGTLNCGKPAGFVKDFAALPEDTRNFYKEIKRTRVMLGTVTLIDPIDIDGFPSEVKDTPCIWEVDNRDAYKTMGTVFSTIGKEKLLPVQVNIKLATEQTSTSSGVTYSLPIADPILSSVINISEDDKEIFVSLKAWLDNYNTYIVKSWEKLRKEDEVLGANVVSEFMDIELE